MRLILTFTAVAFVVSAFAQEQRTFTRRTLGPERNATAEAASAATEDSPVFVAPADGALPAPDIQAATEISFKPGAPRANPVRVEPVAASRPALPEDRLVAVPIAPARPAALASEVAQVPVHPREQPPETLAVTTIDPAAAAYAVEVARLQSLPALTIPMRNIALHTALRAIAASSEMSYIAPPEKEFSEPVTLRFNGNPWSLLSILKRRHNFEMAYEDGIWTFYRPNAGALIARTYQLRYVSLATVKSNGHSGGSAVISSNSNSASSASATSSARGNIFSVETKEIIEKVKTLLGIPVTGMDALIADAGVVGEMAPIRTGAAPVAALESPKSDVIYLSDSNQLFVIATSQQHQYVEEFLKVADTQQPLVRIDAILVETARDPRSFIGIDPSGYARPSVAIQSAQPGTTGGSFGLNTEGKGTLTTPPFNMGDLGSLAWPEYAVLSTTNLNFQLNLLQQDSTSIVKNRPRLMTSSNREVSIESVIEEPFASSTTNNAFQGSAGTAGQTTTSLDRIKIGTIINVLPQVMRGSNGQRYVKLHVAITISGKVGDKSIFGQAVPITSSTSQSFVVDVPDGYTLALGGLDETRESDIVNKVPIAGDIPVVGYLFKSKSTQNTKRNLIAYITPKIVDIQDADLVRSTYEAMPSEEQFTKQRGYKPEQKTGTFQKRSR